MKTQERVNENLSFKYPNSWWQKETLSRARLGLST